MNQQYPPVNGTKHTSAVMTKLWLTTFRGFRIQSAHRTPTAGLFGRIKYKTHWVLAKKGSKG